MPNLAPQLLPQGPDGYDGPARHTGDDPRKLSRAGLHNRKSIRTFATQKLF